ncbi:MAG: 16S rRNA processing protein RimM [Cyclobacteriaceae bacterium]|nr:16S rRNA processing protein RimM [Phycisphaerales bacterium]NJN24670.1 16S rRNA processing protein RimM [Cyclobacteriaceae bacterium]
MQPGECFEIGFILKPHGLKGGLSIELDVDDPSKYTKMESVIVKMDNTLVPFFVSSLQLQGKKGILYLEDINTIDDAEPLRSCSMLLPLSQLPKLKKNQFYYHEVIGYSIVDENLGQLGLIESVFSTGNQDLIAMRYKEKEILIPVSDEIVSHADHAQRQMMVNLPEGLLDIYLHE